MTFKQEIKSRLETLTDLYAKNTAKVEAIYEREELSDTGKENEVIKLQADLWGYLGKVDEAIKARAEEITQHIDTQEAEGLKQKAGNAEYATLLANTLAILPAVLDDCDRSELRNRLAIFENDPVAISAIKRIITEHKPGLDGMAYDYILPKDRRGVRQNTLRQLVDTFSNELHRVHDAMQLRGRGYDGSLPASIRSTIEYVEGCNDDCTEYLTIEETKDAPTGVFDFGFRRVRGSEE